MKKIILFIVCLYLGGVIMSSAIDKVEENTWMSPINLSNFDKTF